VARAGDWDPRHLPDLTGRRYLITGANKGIGYFSAEQLVGAGAHVILTGRNPNRLSAAHAAIERRVLDVSAGGSGAGSVETLLLDTSNLGSVRAAAASARARGPLDGVVLNAGMVHPPKHRETVDGHELVFATNVLGHFALAGELLQNLAVVGGRLVWLGSIASSLGDYEPRDPDLREGYSAWRAYAQSKVATTALGLEADRRLRAQGVPVASVIAHPGYSTSGRTTGIHGVNEPSRFARFADNLQTPITHSKEHGAWSIVRAVADPSVHGGELWGPRYLMHGSPRRATPARVARDPEVGARLWAFCEIAARVRWPFEKAAKAARRLR
jgi:NAD(P)-dependent dehydrogenase (short-subunit alcohol dehydrogenase family)